MLIENPKDWREMCSSQCDVQLMGQIFVSVDGSFTFMGLKEVCVSTIRVLLCRNTFKKLSNTTNSIASVVRYKLDKERAILLHQRWQDPIKKQL
jgi:hypothetical protein